MKTNTLLVALGASFAISLNRAGNDAGFTLPADGWFQIGKVGEMDKELELPGGAKVNVRQVVTAEDLGVIANRFKEWAAEPGFDGLLVDFDHFSADQSKETRAAAWIMNAERRNETELWGQLRLTTSGKAALEGGDYRHFSPVLGFQPKAYNRGEVAHPGALLGGAFTNQPTFRGMLPLSNRADPTTTPVTMNKTLVLALLAALGSSIAADASPEAIDAALTAATEKAKGAAAEMAATKNRLKTLEGEQIERDLDAAGLKGDERKTWAAALTKNREEALPLLASLGTAAGAGDYARTHNRKDATTPANKKDADTLAAQAEAEVQAYRTSNRCSYEVAHATVRRLKPALFLV